MAKSKAPKTPDFERLGEQLYAATMGSSNRRDIALAALCTTIIILGMPQELYRGTVEHLVADERRRTTFHGLWEVEATSFPYLRGNIDPLLRWIDDGREEDFAALDRCFEVLLGVDVAQCIRDAGGDLLGPVYTSMMGPGDKKSGGKFYTPMNVSLMIAKMTAVHEGASVLDPCCGSAGMIIAVVFDMRERGLRPELCYFTLIDIDPIAIALAGVNMASRGMPNVRLICGDSLAMDLVAGPSTDRVELPRAVA